VNTSKEQKSQSRRPPAMERHTGSGGAREGSHPTKRFVEGSWDERSWSNCPSADMAGRPKSGLLPMSIYSLALSRNFACCRPGSNELVPLSTSLQRGAPAECRLHALKRLMISNVMWGFRLEGGPAGSDHPPGARVSQLLEDGYSIRAADMPGAGDLMMRVYAAMAQKEYELISAIASNWSAGRRSRLGSSGFRPSSDAPMPARVGGPV
jgi:hypothetical protein